MINPDLYVGSYTFNEIRQRLRNNNNKHPVCTFSPDSLKAINYVLLSFMWYAAREDIRKRHMKEFDKSVGIGVRRSQELRNMNDILGDSLIRKISSYTQIPKRLLNGDFGIFLSKEQCDMKVQKYDITYLELIVIYYYVRKYEIIKSKNLDNKDVLKFLGEYILSLCPKREKLYCELENSVSMEENTLQKDEINAFKGYVKQKFVSIYKFRASGIKPDANVQSAYHIVLHFCIYGRVPLQKGRSEQINDLFEQLSNISFYDFCNYRNIGTDNKNEKELEIQTIQKMQEIQSILRESISLLDAAIIERKRSVAKR